jgi:hypothetical protein
MARKAAAQARPRRLTVDWLIDNNLPVFVTNNTDPRGQILINFVDNGGHSKNVKIPATFIPICLNDYLPPAMIKESYDLRQYLRPDQQKLVLMDPDAAEKALSSPNAQKEIQRLKNSARNARTALIAERRQRAARQQEAARVAERPLPGDEDMESSIPEENQFRYAEEPGEQISGRVLSLVARLGSGDIKVSEAVADLESRAGELSENDHSYLIANTKGQVRVWAQKQMAGVDEVEDVGETEDIEDEDGEEEAPSKTKRTKRRRRRR